MHLRQQIISITHSRNFRHGMLYTVFSFINSGIGFVLLLILARYLQPADYGSLNLFTNYVTLLGLLIALSTTTFIGVTFFQRSRETLQQVILIAFLTSTVTFLIFGSLLCGFPGESARLTGIPVKYLFIGLAIGYFTVFNNVNLDIWRLEEKPVSYGLYSVSFAVCNFILTFWMIVGLHHGWIGRVYAWGILSTIYFVISIIFMMKRRYLVISRPPVPLIKEVFIYALPLIPHGISFWLKQGLDRYIINYFYSEATVGYFSFAMNFAAIIMIVGNAFNSTNSVNIYKQLAKGYSSVKSSLSRQARLMSILFSLICVTVIIISVIFIYFFLPKYFSSIQYLFPLCIGGLFQCIYLLWVNYLFFYKETRLIMAITFGTALIQTIFSLWLTRYSPIYTAYISMTISIITVIVIHWAAKRKLSKIQKDEKNNTIRS